MSKKLGVALGLLVLFAGVSAFLGSRNNSNVPQKSLLQLSDAAKVAKVVIKKDNTEATLSKIDGGWVIENDGGFPVDASRLAKAFDELSSVKIHRRVSRTKDQHQRLGLSMGTFVELKAKEGDALLSIYLGNERDGGGQYMRFSNSDTSYLIDRKLSMTADISSWELKSLVDVKPEFIRTVDFGKGVVVSREKTEDKFTLKGVKEDQVDVSKLADVGRLLTSVNYLERVSKTNAVANSAMEKPIVTTIELFSGDRYVAKAVKSGSKDQETYFLDISLISKESGNIEAKLLKTMMEKSFFKVGSSVYNKIRMAKSDFLKGKKS